MAPRETENNAYAKFWGDKQRAIYMVFYAFFVVVNKRIQANNNNKKMGWAATIVCKLCYGLSQLCNSARLETVTGLNATYIPD